MKKLLFAALMLSAAGTSFAQSEKYTQAMLNTISRIDSVRSPDDMLAVSAAFERIANAEKSQWLPYYYASFCQTLYAFMKNEPGANDGYADRAEALIGKAEELEKSNSEIACVKSMIASVRMLVDPQTRWQQYGPAVMEQIEKAKKLDPANPRPYYLQGQNLRYTPEEFGGGCTTAKPVLEEAMKKYQAFTPASELHPAWGKEQVAGLLQQCK